MNIIKTLIIIYLINSHMNLLSSSIVKKICPCENEQLCKPLEISKRKEFLGFAVNSTHYPYYDYNSLTSIGIFYDEIEDDFLCLAHENSVRLVWGATYPIDQLTNKTYMVEWIDQMIEKVESTYTDGINFDVEDPLNSTMALYYTQLVSQTNKAFKSINPYYQVSVDVAWDSSNCIDERCYDYKGLSESSDFLVVMDYDIQSRIYTTKCVAAANSPPDLVLGGMLNFTYLGIPSDSLLMGLPWYGYDYPCIGMNYSLSMSECIIPPSNYLGCNCSDASGTEINYSIIMGLLNNTSIKNGGVNWNSNYESPYFNFIDPTSNTQHQMWFDNPKSLTIKVDIAKKLNLGGVAVWNIDQLWEDSELSSGMWESLNSFFDN